MSDRRDFNDAAKGILAAAERALAAREAEGAERGSSEQTSGGAHSILADDTLGRLIQYCLPFVKKWTPRYFKVFFTLGCVFIPLKFWQQHLKSGVSWDRFARWLDVNEPMIVPKTIGITALVAGWLVFTWLAISVERQRWLRKRRSKAVESELDAGFNSQS